MEPMKIAEYNQKKRARETYSPGIGITRMEQVAFDFIHVLAGIDECKFIEIKFTLLSMMHNDPVVYEYLCRVFEVAKEYRPLQICRKEAANG